MDDDTYDLSRRKVLAGLGSVGAASLAGGYGTAAFLSDEERFANNRLVAGSLDAKAAYQSNYSDWSSDEADALAESSERFLEATLENGIEGVPAAAPTGGGTFADFGTAEACSTFLDANGRVVVRLQDVKPGDFGFLSFGLVTCTNPGYVWLNANLRSEAEAGVNEAEAQDSDETSTGGFLGNSIGGELARHVRVRPWYTTTQGGSLMTPTQAFGQLFSGMSSGMDAAATVESTFALDTAPTLYEFASQFSGLGLPLEGAPEQSGAGGGLQDTGNGFLIVNPGGGMGSISATGRTAFAGGQARFVGLAWGLAVDHANEIQSDATSFDVGFYAEQSRHNDGSGGAAAPGEQASVVASGANGDIHTVRAEVPAGAVGSTFGDIAVRYNGGTDVSNVDQGDVTVLGVDRSGGPAADVTAGADEASASSDGSSLFLSVDDSAAITLQAGDTVVAEYGDVSTASGDRVDIAVNGTLAGVSVPVQV